VDVSKVEAGGDEGVSSRSRVGQTNNPENEPQKKNEDLEVDAGDGLKDVPNANEDGARPVEDAAEAVEMVAQGESQRGESITQREVGSIEEAVDSGGEEEKKEGA
jgi:hypothetical protein